MADRNHAIADFLRKAGWSDASRRPLAGDASARRYERLCLGSRSAVLMDAPPEKGESVHAFSRMARWLRAVGFAAPGILAEDGVQGILLVEDLGDAVFARLAAQNPGHEGELYTAATDFLSALHRCPAPGFLAPMDGPALAGLVDEVLAWYLGDTGGAHGRAATEISALIRTECDRLCCLPAVVCLRDFHAENLIWLPKRQGHARVGLLDFQDAVLADPAYDFASLLQDARRDVSPATESAMIARYCTAKGLSERPFRAVYALLGVQRALRIIGIFARLAKRDGRAHYLDYIPRVWGYLQRDLGHPELAALSRAVNSDFPPPTPERLQRIRDSCGIGQTL
ncbi:MAG: phosphotransferase [Rhodobacteraceae bacterium]|nr:phosphotransferase [Paracoccaceae bacterium]MCP5341428.1 phosphotransferase [Paracoccaceae bacterium]